MMVGGSLISFIVNKRTLVKFRMTSLVSLYNRPSRNTPSQALIKDQRPGLPKNSYIDWQNLKMYILDVNYSIS